MEINGIAHVILTARDMERSRPFYQRLLSHMGLTEVVNAEAYLYYVDGRTAVGLRPAGPPHADVPFDQDRSRVVHPPEEAPWVPGGVRTCDLGSEASQF